MEASKVCVDIPFAVVQHLYFHAIALQPFTIKCECMRFNCTNFRFGKSNQKVNFRFGKSNKKVVK